jgi:NADPH:quinone reductase-like Zn-dependent oxidoreductase
MSFRTRPPSVAYVPKVMAPKESLETDRPDLPSAPKVISVRVDAEGLARAINAVASGAVEVHIARRMPLSEGAEAHRLLEAGGMSGKIILEP